MSKRINLLLTVLVLVCGEASAMARPAKKAKSEWDVPVAMKSTLTFQRESQEKQKVIIKGTKGIDLYILDCRLNAFDHDDEDFNFSGDFECRLTPLTQKTRYSTLLTDNPSPTRDWQGRGRFLYEELKLPVESDYGPKRTFRLRGMRLTIWLRKITYAKGAKNPRKQPAIESLTAEIEVELDKAATGEIAEKTSQPCPTPCNH